MADARTRRGVIVDADTQSTLIVDGAAGNSGPETRMHAADQNPKIEALNRKQWNPTAVEWMFDVLHSSKPSTLALDPKPELPKTETTIPEPQEQ